MRIRWLCLADGLALKFWNIHLLILTFFKYLIKTINKVIINTDNVSEYISMFEYIKSDNKLFTSSYIHQFFNSATGSEILLPYYEKLLFDKTLEYRNEFVDYFFTYIIYGKNGKRTYEDFVKSFNK